MFKKAVSIILILTMIAALAIFVGPFGSKRNIQAAEYRNNMRLVPEKEDAAGIAADTSFILYIQDEKTNEVDFDTDPVFIQGQDTPKIERLTDNSYIITPAALLDEGKVYIIGVRTIDDELTTWAYQTSYGLAVVTSFPADKGTYVPLNSGIEIYFNQAGFENYENRFSIEPKVDGRFEVHKNTLVFVPETLEENTIYTVVISSGINLIGSDVKLEDDYTFSFATVVEDIKEGKDNNNGYFSFTRDLTEYSSTEDILVPVYYYMRRTSSDPALLVDTEIYAFGDIKDFKKAYEQSSLVPYWARGQLRPEAFDTKDLELILTKTFELPASPVSNSDSYLNFENDLPKGYYIIQAKYGDFKSQTFIQVTDLAVFVMNTNTGYFIWVKDLLTKENVSGAELLFDTQEKYHTDNQGIITSDLKNSSGSNMALISSKDDAIIVNVYDYDHTTQWYYNNSARFWNVFQTDRNLYKPDDTISYFGFIKSRQADDQVINELTLEISRGGFRPYFSPYVDHGYRTGFYFPGMGEPMLKETIKLDSNFFEGSLLLPSLAPGSYNLQIKDKDRVISSVYITVKTYTKPSYKLELKKDKNAIFYGESIEFLFRSMFFEGTPVANLDFRIDAGIYFGSDRKTIDAKTDINGEYVFEYTPTNANSNAQGLVNAYITAISSVPEMGEISVNDNFYVFMNDIWAFYDSSIKDGVGKLDIEVNYVDLDKINDSFSYDQKDLKGAPAARRQISGRINKIAYKRVVTGEYYDYINKVKRNTYSYERVVTPIKQFELLTDGAGKAFVEFVPEDSDNHIYYTAEFSLTDSNGREIRNTAYFYNHRSLVYYYEYNDEYSRLEIEGDNRAKIGDEVKASYLHFGHELTKGDYAYIMLQNGIKDIQISDSSRHSFVFDKTMMPNMFLGAVYFTGKIFEYVESYVGFDHTSREITIKAMLDKDSYRPGDIVKIDIQASDANGEPVSAFVNAAIVDEALFALGEQYINTLESLFANIGNGMKYKYSTHSLEQYFYAPAIQRGAAVDGAALESAPSQDKAILLEESESTVVRSEFKDTAYYGSVMLNEEGRGIMEFTLPHNITSWRVTLQGVSDQIQAGSDKVSLNVTMPMFINYSLSDVFLVGDRPYIGVSVYGTALDMDDEIEIAVILNDTVIGEVKINAFERGYVQLPTLSEAGDFEIFIHAKTQDGLEDIVVHKYRVITTFNETDNIITKKARAGMQLPKGAYGITTYSFTDESTGKYASTLYSLAYQQGNRIEQKVISYIAAQLISEYFDQDHKHKTANNIMEYQKSDGGIAFLPYGDSDIYTTVMMLPYIKGSIDKSMVKMYLYDVLDSANQPNSKSAALYGLSILKEPVLLQLKEYEKIDNIDTIDRIYLALAFAEFNELAVSRRIYSTHIEGKVTTTGMNARLDIEGSLDERIKNTALLAMLCAKVDLPNKTELFNYISKEYTNQYLTIVEKLEFIRTELDGSTPKEASVVYEYLGERKTLILGPHQRSVNVLSKLASQFKIISVTGDVNVHAVYKVSKALSSSGNSISISREYTNFSRPGEDFGKNDLIKVTLRVFIGKDALAKEFQITDYLPSGLRAIENFQRNAHFKYRDSDMRYYVNVQGQKVYFSVYGDRDKDSSFTISYMARVVNPGVFKAQRTVMRGYLDKNLIAVGEDKIIVISNE